MANLVIMKTALVYGASGLVGQSLVHQLLEHTGYSKITVLVRRKLELAHQKLAQVIIDFDKPAIEPVYADEVYCCMGTTIKKAGSKAAFYKVDHDYVLNIARLAKSNGVQKFAFVSSMGADANSRIFYSKTKGEVEADLVKTGFESLFIFRPSLLLGARTEKRIGEQVAAWLMVNLNFLVPARYKAIEASQVAKAMLYMMNSGKAGIHVLESQEIAAI